VLSLVILFFCQRGSFFLTATYLQASSEHSVCFAVPEKEVALVSAALHARFREALAAGRLSKVYS
jgi:hypothetical protein